MRNDYDAPEGESFDELYQSDGLRWMSILVVLLVVGGFFSLAWYAYQTNTQDVTQEGEVLTVEADQNPFREKPEDPGGMKFQHQDKEVYNHLIAGEETNSTVERLLPAPEEPTAARELSAEKAEDTESFINKDIHPDVEVAEKEAPVPVEEKAEEKTETPTPVEEKPEEKTVVKEDVPAYTPPKPVEKPWVPKATAKVEAPTPTPAKPTETIIERVDPIVAQAEKFSAPPAAPKVIPVPAPAPSSPPVAASGGTMAAQLAALRSRQEAETMWQKLSAKHADLLGGKPHSIMEANIPGKGMYYRLRVSVSAAEGKTLCAALQGRGQACLLVK